MRTSPRRKLGILLVEAVIGSFLMIFAFAAASSLFGAALQWESRGANMRAASLVAQRKMAELRAWNVAHHGVEGFSADWTSQETTSTYPDAPGLEGTVQTALMHYDTTPAGQANPPLDGFYSPCSSFFNVPLVAPPANQQWNRTWGTFSYSRDLSDSYRRVQVTVNYGSGGGQELVMVSLIGDPISPLVADPVQIVKVSGPTDLSKSAPNTFATYQVIVNNADGNPVPDVPALWSLVPTSTGNVRIVPQDPSAQFVQVYPGRSSGVDTEAFLTCKIRYAGEEILGETTTPIGIGL